MPAQINLVDRDEVSLEKSPRSIQATFSPRDAASKATPAPVAPPPITSTSKASSFPSFVVWFSNLLICSARDGKPEGAGTSWGSETTLVIDKPASRSGGNVAKERALPPQWKKERLLLSSLPLLPALFRLDPDANVRRLLAADRDEFRKTEKADLAVPFRMTTTAQRVVIIVD